MLHSLLFAAAALAVTVNASPPDRSTAQSKNGEFIFSKYPPRALAAGEQGAVGFRADVDVKGNVLGCVVTRSSGYSRLDNETCELIVSHATFTPSLDADGRARQAVHDGIVNWRIPGAAAAPETKVAAVDPQIDKVKCKRISKTGSLVSHSRLCLTQREWDRYAEQTQDEWGDLQGRKGSTHGN